MYLCMSNPYLAGFVAKQEGQKVCTSGVYAIVRHPMYLGGFVLMLSYPVYLESKYGIMIAGIIFFFLCVRVKYEEEYLRSNLSGYLEYTKKVKRKIIPFIY